MVSHSSTRKVAKTPWLKMSGGAVKFSRLSVDLKLHVIVPDPVHAFPCFQKS